MSTFWEFGAKLHCRNDVIMVIMIPIMQCLWGSVYSFLCKLNEGISGGIPTLLLLWAYCFIITGIIQFYGTESDGMFHLISCPNLTKVINFLPYVCLYWRFK